MYNETKLDNGLLIVSEQMDTVETVAVGVFVGAGARLENAKNNGISHFLEHMAFKGTQRRTALEIAAEIEGVGGNMNAYTSYESTAYYVKTLKEDMPLSLDILADILQNPTFPENEMERERGVILQEINHTLDSPDDYVFELAQMQAWPDNPLGRPIAGTAETVRKLTTADLRAYMKSQYQAGNMLVAAAGNLNHDDLVKLVTQHFGSLPKGEVSTFPEATFKGAVATSVRAAEQQQLVFEMPGIPYGHPDYYAAHVWNTLLGGGMASRLFQDIREKRGLVYSVFSYLQNYEGAGVFGVYAATGPEQVEELATALGDCLKESTQNITEEELNRARTQLKASLMMGQESTSSRMNRLAFNQMVHGRHVPLKETLAQIDAVTVADMQRVATFILGHKEHVLAGVGPVAEAKLAALRIL